MAIGAHEHRAAGSDSVRINEGTALVLEPGIPDREGRQRYPVSPGDRRGHAPPCVEIALTPRG